MEEALFTPAQVADKLQVAEKTVQRWLIAGTLKGIKLGRLWRIKPEDLDAFLSQHATKTN